MEWIEGNDHKMEEVMPFFIEMLTSTSIRNCLGQFGRLVTHYGNFKVMVRHKILPTILELKLRLTQYPVRYEKNKKKEEKLVGFHFKNESCIVFMMIH